MPTQKRQLMTIHSDWSRILHDECAGAFTAKPPVGCRVDIGVIDGHLQLMRLDVRMRTWECFVRNQFLKPIQALFNLGCPRVVLCFDNYGAVPSYKSMTQTSRTNRFQIRNFGPQDELPASIPEDPITFLMNRNFKLKLIHMLCERVPKGVTLEMGQEFLLDYKRVVRYTPQGAPPTVVQDMASMGESDVKFCRYVSRYGNALVHAIDGDYMAIALLYYAVHGLCPKNKIFIYRQLAVLNASAGAQDKKRKAAQMLATAADEEARATTSMFFKPCTAARESASSQPPKCWVNMQMVYNVIGGAMLRSAPLNPHTGLAFSSEDAVYSAVYLMLCAGTDFSRNTPLLGPKRMWEALPTIGGPLLEAVRGTREVNEKLFLNRVVARLYALNFKKHIPVGHDAGSLEHVLRGMQKSKLSDGTKQKLPSMERMGVTLRNVAWVIKYWGVENGQVETPEDGRYGFARNAVGDLTFVDLLKAEEEASSLSAAC